MDRLTVNYGKSFKPFQYATKDGSDAEPGYFKNYDAFFSHMMLVQKLGEYEDLEEQGRLIKFPAKNDTTEYRECVHTRASCHHTESKCSECPLTELFCDEFYVAIDRCYEDAYASGWLAGIELGKSFKPFRYATKDGSKGGLT